MANTLKSGSPKSADKGGGRNNTKALIVGVLLVFVCATIFWNQNILTELNKGNEQVRAGNNNPANSTRYKKLVESHAEELITLTKTHVEQLESLQNTIDSHAETIKTLKEQLELQSDSTNEVGQAELQSVSTTQEVGEYKYPELGADFVDDYIDHCADESCMKAYNVSTVTNKPGGFYSGFRNQMMVFTAIVINTHKKGHGQIFVGSLKQKDTYGTNKYIPFERLWDVGYWNSFYPLLPRLVRPDPVIHDQWDVENDKYYWYNGSFTDANNSTWTDRPTRPAYEGKQHHLFGAYQRYSRGVGGLAEGLDGHRHPAEILMMRGAMRPHAKLRKLIDGFLASLRNGTDTTEPVEYMTLHARIEPDMQKHPVCKHLKVLNLTDIFDWIQEKWPDPPAKHIFMPINRQMLEKEGREENLQYHLAKNQTEHINWIAVNNLRALNEARDKGLWGGRAKVFEFGANALKDTEFADRPSTIGALVNFFIAIGGNIFVGTTISTYAHDILATRFFRNKTENCNYLYLPDGLHDWTPPGTIDPPGSQC